MSIAGARPHWNNWRVDGITVNDYMNAAPGNALGVSLAVDAIEEFTVVTNNYSAAYGRTGGGMLNAITLSGTNEFHGTAFEFLRNSKLDARNFFAPATIPAFRRNRFGGSTGARIIRDKTFAFANYEGLRHLYGDVLLATAPSPAIRNGYTCKSPTDTTADCSTSGINALKPITVSPAVKPYLGLWGPVNFGLLGPTGNSWY
jgi:hypothetical protein